MTDVNESLIKLLVPLIGKFKQDPLLELEGSLGIRQDNRFVTGVTFDYFKALHTALDTAEAGTWSTSTKKSHFASFFYPNSIRARHNVRDKPVYVSKITVCNCDLNCKQRQYDLRIALSKESPLVFSPIAGPQYVRLHERWSFTYRDTWRYDFTKVCSGTNKETACRELPVFEVELELLRTPLLAGLSNEIIAQHLLEKLTDLLGRFDTTGSVLPLQLKPDRIWTNDATGDH